MHTIRVQRTQYEAVVLSVHPEIGNAAPFRQSNDLLNLETAITLHVRVIISLIVQYFCGVHIGMTPDEDTLTV